MSRFGTTRDQIDKEISCLVRDIAGLGNCFWIAIHSMVLFGYVLKWNPFSMGLLHSVFVQRVVLKIQLNRIIQEQWWTHHEEIVVKTSGIKKVSPRHRIVSKPLEIQG